MERDGLQTFIAQTAHRILTREEERRLAVRIQQGDRQALDTLVLHNVRLVYSIARRWSAGETPLDDLIQFGMLGLIRAAQKFDGEKGFKFSTYATWWITQAIDRGACGTERTIRLPQHIIDRLKRLANAEREAMQREGVELSDAEAAARLDLSVKEVAELRRVRQRTLDLDGFLGPDGEPADGQNRMALAGEDETDDHLERQAVRQALERLPDRQREVVALRYGLDGGEELTFEEIGRRFGVSRSAVQQTHAVALAALRKRMAA